MDDHVAVVKLHPDTQITDSEAYRKYQEKRDIIISVIRDNSIINKDEYIETLVDSILENEVFELTGILSVINFIFKTTKKYKQAIKKKEIIKVVISKLLEKIFDPILKFQLTEKDIKDCFEATGISRHDVTRDHISKIYSSILDLLQSGELRDELHKNNAIYYAQLKITEIRNSRMSWEVSR